MSISTDTAEQIKQENQMKEKKKYNTYVFIRENAAWSLSLNLDFKTNECLI